MTKLFVLGFLTQVRTQDSKSQVNTGYRPTQVITGQLRIFNKNWHRTCAGWGALTHNATWPSDHVVMWSRVTIKNKISPFLQGQSSDLWWGKLSHDTTWLPDNVFTQGHMTKWKLNISSSAKPMITKLCRLVTCDEGNSPTTLTYNATWLYDHKVCEVMWQTKNKISPLPQRLWPPTLGNLPIMSQDPLTIWQHEVMWKIKNISSSWGHFATKLGRVITDCENNSPMKLHDPLITCSSEVMWQIKDKISSLQQGLQPPNLAGQQLMLRGTHTWSHMTLWSRAHATSCNKLKT